MKNQTIQILLPTFNGSKHLKELLASLCNQTYKEFTLLTYDDGSHDNSIKMVDSYSRTLSIIRLANPLRSNKGAVKSFEFLLQHATGDVILFCDQDDIWHNDKVETLFNEVIQQTTNTPDLPITVFSDLIPFSDSSAMEGPSFLSVTGCNPEALVDPYYITFRNPAPGCAIAINRACCKAILPFNEKVLMHDWWIVLITVLKGKLQLIEKPLIHYRIHESNTLGMAPDRAMSPLLSLFSMLSLKKPLTIFKTIHANTVQGKHAFSACGKHFSPLLFWVKCISGRYFFPTLARLFPQFQRYSWKRINDT